MARARQRSGRLRLLPIGFTPERFQAHVINPHLADIGLTDDPEIEGDRGCLALGADDALNFGPAADGFQVLLETAPGEDCARRWAYLCTGQA